MEKPALSTFKNDTFKTASCSEEIKEMYTHIIKFSKTSFNSLKV